MKPLIELGFDPTDKGLAHLFSARIAVSHHLPAVRYFVNNKIRTESWLQVSKRVEGITARLQNNELVTGSIVGLFLPTCYAWVLTDIACLNMGWISAVYHSAWCTDELSQAILLQQPKIIVCHSNLHDTLKEALGIAKLKVPILLVRDPGADDETDMIWTSSGVPPKYPSIDNPYMPATIVFTSGTGGCAKGVELTQNAMLKSAWYAYQCLGFNACGSNTLHWLPLSHMFGRIGIYLDWIAGSTGHLSRSVDRLAEDMMIAKPHVLFAVPQLLSRLKQKIDTKVMEKPFIARLLFITCIKVANLTTRKGTKVRLAVQLLLRKVIFSSVHKPLGGNLSLVIVGSAPVEQAEKDYFEGLGVAVREGFGMTETAGVASVQPLHKPSSGAGFAINGLQTKIDNNGELLLRGSTMLSKYININTYDDDGWFHTGDIASLAKDGSIHITGRLKEIIIPASGENINPKRIEDMVCSHNFIDDACVIGDRRPCLIVIISLSQEGREALVDKNTKIVNHAIAAHLEKVNQLLPKFALVRSHIIAEKSFSVGTGELTITNKKKRQVIMDRYNEAIEVCYSTLRDSYVHSKAVKRIASLTN